MTIARCESMWARLKTELLYDRYNSENLTVSELEVSNLEIPLSVIGTIGGFAPPMVVLSHAQATEIL